MIRISDNSKRQLSEREKYHLPNLKEIAQLKINNKTVANDGLLIFSNNQETIDDEQVFSVDENEIKTSNMMGFIGLKETEVAIQSRFSSEGNDYFLHYMLQKVYSINLFDLKHSASNENIFDFLMYLFPFYLKKALRQGIYKEYKRKEYNNSNIKGAINIGQHLKRNIPFRGNVAYSAREQSYDNKITQLIRHTIEFIKKHKLANNILSSDSETQKKVNEIIQATPSFENNSRTAIINNNLRPMAHPYFSEYTDLQRICLQILRYEGLKYGQEKDKIYGILFDGAWLWEEYTSTFLKDCGFKHPRNDVSKDGIQLFQSRNGYTRYPDFWKEGFIIDAKYKRLENGSIKRDDMHQIITYMYVKQAKIGGFIYPNSSDKSEMLEKEVGHLNGYNGIVKKWKFPIPVGSSDFDKFCESIRQNEEKIIEIIKANDKVLINI
jgi:5-methylcytosine-specific restriction endonuclease McrBC regulatory subunit McrC